jgi:hypothetical protein
LALLVQSVPAVRRVDRGRKDLSVPKGQSGSAGQLVHPGRLEQSDRRARREMPAAKVRSGPAANAGHLGLRVLLVQPVP